MIAWPLAGSRLKWLVWRAESVLVIGLVLVGLGLLARANASAATAMDAAYEAAFQAGEPEPDPATLPQEVFTGISAARHGEVVLRESLALGALATGLFGVATAVVGRRRPE